MASASPPTAAAPAPAIPSPPPSNPAAPAPSNSTAPPPSSPPVAPPPAPVPPPAPQPPAPAPPPAPSAPPPASPAPPPSSPPAPPPSSPAPPDSPPPTPSAPSDPPPPPTSTPVTPAIKPPPPPPSSRAPPPPPHPPPPSSNGLSTAAVAGVAVGATVFVLGLLALIGFLCCRKRRRRDQHPYYGEMPPPPPPSKDGLQNMQAQNWQYSTPPPVYQAVNGPPQPSPPPSFPSRPPHPPNRPTTPPAPPLPVISNSGGSSSGYSGSEYPLPPPPPPGVTLGFSKSIFTYEELTLATNGFSEANLLGQGGFGYVHKGTLLGGKEVAIKQLKPGSGQGEREFQAEVETISRVNHRHLVSLVGYCISGVQRLLVYEYVPNRTLEFHLHGKDHLPLDWPTRLKIALGSAKGLAYLHEDCNPKIIHRDIKASNILLDFNYEAKVADFGLAKLTSDNDTHISTRVMGTFGYLAPEYANSGKLTDKSDVYSFGIMLLELITGRRPIGSSSLNDSLVDWARPLLTQTLEEGDYDVLTDPQLESYNLEEMSHMVACAAACIRHSSRRRPKMSQVVRALEGSVSLDDLNPGMTPSNNWVRRSHPSSDYDSSQYKEDMKKLTKVALASQNYGSSEYSAGTSEYGQNMSVSSSEGQQTREMEMSKMKKDYKDAAALTGQNVSASSSEGQQTQEMETSKIKNDEKDAAALTGHNVSASSSEGRQTQEMEMSKMKKDEKDAAGLTE